jgi:hypothetical protein
MAPEEQAQFDDGFRDAFALGLALALESQELLRRAKVEAEKSGPAEVGPLHLLMVLLEPGGSLASELGRRGVDLAPLAAIAREMLGQAPTANEPGGAE